MAGQINTMNEDVSGFRNFQTKCEFMLGTLLKNQNAIQQEIFLLKNQTQRPTVCSPEKVLVTEEKEKHIPAVPMPKKTQPAPTVPAPEGQSSKVSNTSSDLMILHMGDARGLVDYDTLEETTATKSEFKKISKANAGKCSEFLPEIISSEISTLNPKCLILQTGYWSVNYDKDISSVDFECSQQQSIITANNAFCAATRALRENSTLEKVVLMKLPVRRKFSSTKTSLSKTFNNTLEELHRRSPNRHKILLINDRYHKKEVTADIIYSVSQIFSSNPGNDKTVINTGQWLEPKHGRGFQRQNSRKHKTSRNNTYDPLPIRNRFQPPGNSFRGNYPPRQ